ncbi:MAG: TonB family protein [Endomicrobium sp.]|nr:TonB family protein [Endomicrobium sp.]
MKEKPTYLFTPIDVTFYSPSPKIAEPAVLPSSNEESISNTSDAKEQPKKFVKTKEDVLVKKKKNSVKKTKETDKKSVKKPESVKKTSDNAPIPTETARPLKSESLSSNGNGSLYTGAFFDANDFKYPYYASQIRRKAAGQWRWAESYGSLRVLLYFKISRDGSVSDISVKESSGNEDYDRNALDTIRRASPFSELPEGYEGESLGVFFEFKY